MKNMKAALICVAIIGIALVAIPANAGSIKPKGSAIDFSSSGPGNLQHTGGSIQFTKGFGNVLTITNAPIYELHAPAGSHGPSKNGLYAVTSGDLNVTTGPCISFCNGINGNGFQGANFSGTGSSLADTDRRNRQSWDRQPCAVDRGILQQLGVQCAGDPCESKQEHQCKVSRNRGYEQLSRHHIHQSEDR